MSGTAKLKIKFIVEVEYDADPNNYPKEKRTPKGMLEVDLGNANEDPFLMLGNDANWTITGEVVSE